MQRYRFNLRLLFGTLAGSLFVAAVAFFFVHPWQVDRKATRFLERANEALAENDLRKAYDYQYKYVRFRSKDDEARIKLANLAADISELDDATREEWGIAYQRLEDAVRRTGDPGIRRRFADMLMISGRPQNAIVHIKELLVDEPNNSEIQALQVKALFLTKDFTRSTELALGLIGYNKQSKEFVAEKATAANQPEIYALLATALHQKSETRELSRRVIDQLIKVNPESFDAYLKRSAFLYQIDEQDEANAALDKAYELAPTDSLVLQRKGQVALQEEDYDKAKEFFEQALELYPDKIELYQLLAHTEIQRNQYEEAIAVLDQGIQSSDKRRSLQLLILKIDLLFETKNISAFKEEVDKLSKVKISNLTAIQTLVDYQNARLKWFEKKWSEAAKELNRVRPLLLSFPSEQIRAGFLLGVAYEQLGKFDLAMQSYTLVLQSQPKYAPALTARDRVLKRIRPDQVPEAGGFNLALLTKEMLARPEDQQDWGLLDDQLVEHAREEGLPDFNIALQRAQVFLDRKMFSDSKQLIQDAVKLEPNNAQGRFAEVQFILRSPSGGPEKAWEQLEKTVEHFGISVPSRALRIEILLALNEDDIVEKLHALTAGTEEWTPRQQVQLVSGLAGAFQRLRLPAESLQYWKRAVKLTPNNLPIRMHLFDFAIQQRDADAIRDAQQEILELVGDQNDASYILTEVKRRILEFSLEQISREEVIAGRNLLDVALQQRPRWSELHVLYGQLLVLLNEDLDLALQHLDDALEFGRANAGAVGLQVQLLSRRGRFDEAREVMNRLPQEVRSRILGSTEAEVLLATGDNDGAYEAAERIAAEQADVVKTQKWFAKLAHKAGKLDAASAAYQKAAELAPEDVDNWSQLLSIYATQRKSEELVDVFHRAQLSLDAEFLPLLAAKSFEFRGLRLHAEKIYLAAFSGRYDEVAIARRLAEFYLLWSPADPSYPQKAGSFINRILRATYEGKIPTDHPQAAWARAQAARQLATTGNYQDSLKAQQLLAQGAVDGKLPLDIQLQLANILASRNDPTSKEKAIRLLTELRSNGQLQKKGVLLLAQLLRDANQWERCEELVLDSLSTFGGDVQVWFAYIGMLIDRGDYTTAQSRIDRLKRLDPQGTSYLQLQARLAFKKDDQELVRKSLLLLLPKNLKGTLESKEIPKVRAAAQLAIQCGDLELAEKIYGVLIKQPPMNDFELVQFQAIYGDAEKAVAEMKKEFPNRMDQVLTLAAQMLRKRRIEFGDLYDSEFDRMMSVALRDDPDSAQRLLLRAELLEIEQKYQPSADAYDKLLARDDVPPRIRAAAMNNLAFLLSLMGERLAEAEQYVNQAMDIFGPIDALLDTRALVKMAGKNYDSAVEDMTLAVTVGRDPVKYFHLARAQLLAGDKEGALKSWKVAKELGIAKEKLAILEQPSFEEFESKIGTAE